MNECQNARRVMLPIGPIREAITRDAARAWEASDRLDSACAIHPGLEMLAETTSRQRIHGRALRRIMNESVEVTEDLVDRYCVATGRHIFDLYPDLREVDQDCHFTSPCRFCPSATMMVMREWRLRMWVRCIDCGRGQYVHHPRARRTGPRPRFTEEQALDMRRLYESGLNTYDLARMYAADKSVIRSTLIRVGTTMRPRNPPPNYDMHGSEGIQAYMKKRTEMGERNSWAAGELRLQGFTHYEIAARLGLSRTGVARALERLNARHPDWREQLQRGQAAA